MKLALLSGILFVIVVGLFVERFVLRARLASRDAEIAFLQRPLTIEAQIKAIQQQVGAEVDGVIGYETMGKANARVKEERWEEHNQFALKWFDANSYGATAKLSCE